MSRIIYSTDIKNRIISFGEGSVFIPSDFLDIADRNVIDKTLSRMVESGTIRRICQGVYDYPKYSSFLKEYVLPSVNDIAETIARKNGWDIIPWRDVALNRLGLSTQVPAYYIFASDGPSKVYKLEGVYNRMTIEFKTTPKKDISNMSEKTALIIQAQKAVGKDGVNDRFIKTVSYKMTREEKETALKETMNSTGWIHENFKKIARESEL